MNSVLSQPSFPKSVVHLFCRLCLEVGNIWASTDQSRHRPAFQWFSRTELSIIWNNN